MLVIGLFKWPPSPPVARPPFLCTQGHAVYDSESPVKAEEEEADIQENMSVVAVKFGVAVGFP